MDTDPPSQFIAKGREVARCALVYRTRTDNAKFAVHCRAAYPKALEMLELAIQTLQEIAKVGTTGHGNTVECTIAYEALVRIAILAEAK